MRTSFITLAAAVVVLVTAATAQAGIEVTRSTEPRIKVGAKFPDGATFDIAGGKQIEVLKTPENTTHEIAGPYKGTLARYMNPCPWWRALIGSCKAAGDENKEGGTRGMVAPK